MLAPPGCLLEPKFKEVPIRVGAQDLLGLKAWASNFWVRLYLDRLLEPYLKVVHIRVRDQGMNFCEYCALKLPIRVRAQGYAY